MTKSTHLYVRQAIAEARVRMMRISVSSTYPIPIASGQRSDFRYEIGKEADCQRRLHDAWYATKEFIRIGSRFGLRCDFRYENHNNTTIMMEVSLNERD